MLETKKNSQVKQYIFTACYISGTTNRHKFGGGRGVYPRKLLGAVTMLLLVFKFIVGLYIACFNGSRFVAVTFFSAECRDMRCFYVF